MWKDERGANLLDTGAHFYDVYETKDGKYVSIGSIEPQFYAELLAADRARRAKSCRTSSTSRAWPALKERFAGVFRTKTRDEWCAIMEGTDVCFAPVLSLGEALEHPHMKARGTFVEVDGVAAAGARAALQPDAGQGVAAGGRRAASTPRRRSATGASPPTSSASSARRARSANSVTRFLGLRRDPLRGSPLSSLRRGGRLSVRRGH